MRVCGKVVWGFVVVAAFALVSGCSEDNSSGNPNPGGPSGGGGGGGGTSGTTITISTTGVSPKNLIIARGTQVTFVNNNVPHDMQSDPHPAHTDCPEIASVGFLSANQSKQTGNFNTARTCGYHDHNREFDATLQGTITIQ